MTDDRQRGWSEYEKLVLFRLTALEVELHQMRKDVVSLKVKSSIWGAISGLIMGILSAVAHGLIKQ